MSMKEDIWFVDDDATFRFVVKKFIGSAGYHERVSYFDDGDIALLAVINAAEAGTAPKLIFLDLNMNNLEGWQMLDLLNEFERKVNVVILRSSLNPKDKERADSEPLVKAFISKPVDEDMLSELIERYG